MLLLYLLLICDVKGIFFHKNNYYTQLTEEIIPLPSKKIDRYLLDFEIDNIESINTINNISSNNELKNVIFDSIDEFVSMNIYKNKKFFEKFYSKFWSNKNEISMMLSSIVITDKKPNVIEINIINTIVTTVVPSIYGSRRICSNVQKLVLLGMAEQECRTMYYQRRLNSNEMLLVSKVLRSHITPEKDL